MNEFYYYDYSPPSIPVPDNSPSYSSYPLRRELVDRINDHQARHPDCDIDRLVNDAVWHAIEKHESETGTGES